MSPLSIAASKKEVPVTFPVRHISVSIQSSPEAVYKFASDPQNMPKWADGLSKSTMVKSGDEWISESPMGKVKVKFTPQNNFGVIDHEVTLPSGEVVHNPLRVLKNGKGSEVVFTLYRRPEVSDQEFEADAKAVTKDLETLKNIFK
ncbi:Polyketide cyclase / dehydrase and lipid transport [compost metagenome]